MPNYEDKIGSGNISSGVDVYDDYIASRNNALANRANIDAHDLSHIHNQVADWFVDGGLSPTADSYDTYNEALVRSKMLGLCAFMDANFPGVVSDEEKSATRLFVESSFANYHPDNGLKVPPDSNFSFVVPMRNSRTRTDYAEEVEAISPILRYAPKELRAAFAVGLPPLILDYYLDENDNTIGYLVLAPIYEDMIMDIGDWNRVQSTFNKAVNDAIKFSKVNLGSKIVGLGATLPAYTNFGKSIDVEGITTTTGHGGTVQLVESTIDRALDEDHITSEQLRNIGVLGLGSIGFSFAHVLGEKYKDSSEFYIYDKDERGKGINDRALAHLRSIGVKDITIASSEREVLERSGVIVSAVKNGGPFADSVFPASLEGKLIVDDSQPSAFNYMDVFNRGGTAAWPIGTSENGYVRRASWGFGSMGHPNLDLFGCESEAWAIWKDYTERGDVALTSALRGPVNPENMKPIASLFRELGIVASNLQIDGRYVRDVMQARL